MNTENLSTLKIHKLTQAQYDRELEAGRIDKNALYLTPDESNVGKNVDGTIYTIDGVEVAAGVGAEVFNDYAYNIATGEYSHAEGGFSYAAGDYSHAEGLSTIANLNCSHAEGNLTVANGDCSHAEGEGTVANGSHQHVQGKYNIADEEDKYAHIVGNGNSYDDCSNAHTVDWDGNGWYAGNIECSYVILKSPNGTRFKVIVDDNGNLSASRMV